jgi:hypothetical protein
MFLVSLYARPNKRSITIEPQQVHQLEGSLSTRRRRNFIGKNSTRRMIAILGFVIAMTYLL